MHPRKERNFSGIRGVKKTECNREAAVPHHHSKVAVSHQESLARYHYNSQFLVYEGESSDAGGSREAWASTGVPAELQ